MSRLSGTPSRVWSPATPCLGSTCRVSASAGVSTSSNALSGSNLALREGHFTNSSRVDCSAYSNRPIPVQHGDERLRVSQGCRVTTRLRVSQRLLHVGSSEIGIPQRPQRHCDKVDRTGIAGIGSSAHPHMDSLALVGATARDETDAVRVDRVRNDLRISRARERVRRKSP